MTDTAKILLEIAARRGRENDATMRAIAAAHAVVARAGRGIK